jgi:UDP-N-acetylglucosamine--N-acetylmuramyl-(pentapeptide) pyrophosphoryl-undecaprenol N-acetylglucosamine transferase
MKIVVTGGGSGGHITPLLAVAHELKHVQPDVKVLFVGQRGDSLGDIPAQDEDIDAVFTVRAGKLRRYHGEGVAQLLDIPTLLKNIRDMLWTVMGIWQAFWLLRRLRPDVVFVKGGFVGVPVGLGAALLRIPYVTHDSDALPGLANRIIAPWASKHAVALPAEIYTYPPEKTVMVGVPLAHHYQPVTAPAMRMYRKQLSLDQFEQVVFVTGGGLGAQRLNDAVFDCVPDLLRRYPALSIVQLAGRNQEADLRQRYKNELSLHDQKRVQVRGFVTNLYAYSGAADVIITRAGATSIAEFAAQAKACIVVPNPLLAGGHQLKNAKVLADRKAVKMVNEDVLNHDHHALLPPLVELLDNPDKAVALGKSLATLAQPDAAQHLAMVLLEAATKHRGS